MSRQTTILILLLLLASRKIPAADWPQWRGPDRDCHLAQSAVWPDSVDESRLTQSWTVSLGPGYSGPVVHGNRVFVTETEAESDEVVHAYDRNTGKELWLARWPGAITVPFFARDNGSWIRSTPACDDRNLYVAGMRDVLVSLNQADGTENWRLDLVQKFDGALPGFGTVCSPVIDGTDLYLQAVASVVKVDTRSGSVIWRSQPESGGLFGAGLGASAFSSPVIATLAGERQLLVQSRNALAGYRLSDGTRLWSIPVEAFRGMNILTPMVLGDTILTSTYGGGTFLYQVSRSRDTFDVREVWHTKKQGYMSSPVRIGAHVFLHLRNQRFTCIDPQTGETQWTTRPFGKYWSLVANGTQLLALDQRGELLLIDAGPKEYREVSRRQVSDTETWAHLAVADQQVFVRELDAMTVWNWE